MAKDLCGDHECDTPEQFSADYSIFWRMNIADYKKRIHFTDEVDVSTATLNALHEHHLYHIPFENLDIHYKQSFGLHAERIFDKIVNRGRGGFCYELNFLFHQLLTAIGFQSTIISCRILNEGIPGPAFDHMALIIRTDIEYLVDTGFGDLFIRPLEIRTGVQHDGRNFFTLEPYDDVNTMLSMSSDGIHFTGKYIFNVSEVSINNFTAPCFDKQTNPSSYFVQNTICTKPTASGRITIFNDKLIERNGDQRTETIIAGDLELRALLKQRFGIVMDQ